MTEEGEPRTSLGFSLRWRITIPFLLLALAIGLGGTYLIIRLLRETEDERFLRQLANSGQLAVDTVVRAESDLLAVQRLVANTDGVVQATITEDAEELRVLVLPLIINAGADVVTIVDEEGVSQLSVRHQLDGGPGDYSTVRGEAFYSNWPFVDRALSGVTDESGGDKYAGLATIQEGGTELEGLFVAGPLRSAGGRVQGAVIVGEYLDELVVRMGTASGANVTLYEPLHGQAVASTLEAAGSGELELPEDWATAAVVSEDETPVRRLELASVPYREALTPFAARGGTTLLGILGVSLIDTVQAAESQALPIQQQTTVQLVIGFAALALLLIGVVGLIISNSITRPLVEIAQASAEVSSGNLDIRVPEKGGGEVTVVARSFNRMVEGLQSVTKSTDWETEGTLPKAAVDPYEADTVPLPEADQADLALLTVALQTRGDSDEREPGEAAAQMDQVLDALETAVDMHRGYLISFDGDRGLAAFGLPPARQPLQVSTLLALHAAFAIVHRIGILDVQWWADSGVGMTVKGAVHCGTVVLSDIGRKYGLSASLMGGTVRIAWGLLAPASQLESGVLLSGVAHDRLTAARMQFEFGRKGVASLGVSGGEQVVHEVKGRHVELVDKV